MPNDYLDDLNAKLTAFFDIEDVDWKPQTFKKDRTQALVVPFISNRAIMKRLDDAVGPLNWKNEFRETTGMALMRVTTAADGNMHKIDEKAEGARDLAGTMVPFSGHLCAISIRHPESGEWISKWDGSEPTAIEPLKGGLSSAMKRAASQWGIGRYLYDFDGDLWLDTEYSRIKPGQEAKIRAFYEKEVKGLSTPQAGTSAAPKKPAPAPVVVKTEAPRVEAPKAKALPEDFIARLKPLMDVLGMVKYEGLNPFAQEFLKEPSATYKSVDGDTAEGFLKFLSTKVDALGNM